MSEHMEDVRKAAKQRREAITKMAKDDGRTTRQREVEACWSEPLPAILTELQDECSSKTEMVSEINERLKANGYDASLSRPTLYNWLRDHDMM